jgi:hypothetical protein
LRTLRFNSCLYPGSLLGEDMKIFHRRINRKELQMANKEQKNKDKDKKKKKKKKDVEKK